MSKISCTPLGKSFVTFRGGKGLFKQILDACVKGGISADRAETLAQAICTELREALIQETSGKFGWSAESESDRDYVLGLSSSDEEFDATDFLPSAHLAGKLMKAALDAGHSFTSTGLTSNGQTAVQPTSGIDDFIWTNPVKFSAATEEEIVRLTGGSSKRAQSAINLEVSYANAKDVGLNFAKIGSGPNKEKLELKSELLSVLRAAEEGGAQCVINPFVITLSSSRHSDRRKELEGERELRDQLRDAIDARLYVFMGKFSWKQRASVR